MPQAASKDFEKQLQDSMQVFDVPKIGDQVEGTVVSADNQEVKLDISGFLIGVIRGPQLYKEDDAYSQLKPGDSVSATVIEEENERGELELSFRVAGQEKAWKDLEDAYKSKETIKVKVTGANRGGLMVSFRQIPGFLPVSQLAPENYPRVSGGDKSKILEKLKKFIGQDVEARVSNFNVNDGKIIFSEKDLWTEQQKTTFSKYKEGDIIEGTVSALADFGIFINFDNNMEGLVHISEIAWRRIDHPNTILKVGDKINAKIINITGTKVFLSIKRLLPDPWEEVDKKYQKGQKATGKIIKINPFGLFVELDEEIHGLAHASQLELKSGAKLEDLFKIGEVKDFIVTSIQAKEHRLGLSLAKTEK